VHETIERRYAREELREHLLEASLSLGEEVKPSIARRPFIDRGRGCHVVHPERSERVDHARVAARITGKIEIGDAQPAVHGLTLLHRPRSPLP
jgi:hypothetical protein